MVVTAFEETAFRNKDKCSVIVVRDALVDAAREVFVNYKVVTKVPAPPQGQEWLNFERTAQAAKPKAKGRPKKEDVNKAGPQLQPELKGVNLM